MTMPTGVWWWKRFNASAVPLRLQMFRISSTLPPCPYEKILDTVGIASINELYSSNNLESI